MWIAVFILLTFAGLAAGAVWFVRTLRTELGALRADSGAQLAERSAAVDRRLEAMTSTLDRRLESTSKTASRSTFTGGTSSSGEAPAVSTAIASLAATSSPCGRATSAGYGV